MSSSDVSTAADSEAVASFALRAARWALTVHRANFDGADQEIVRVPDTAATELVRQVATEVRRLVQQIMPLSAATLPVSRRPGAARRWRFERDQAGIVSLAQALSRSLVETDCRVERVYLVPPGGLQPDLVNRQVDEDASIGIHSKCVQLAGLGSESTTKIPVSLVWIVDEDAVMSQEPTEDGAPVWTVSGRDTDVHDAGVMWRDLWEHASERLDVTPARSLTDPLLESAEQMAAIAPVACADNYSGRNCSWYHGAWQYLRLFGMVSNPGWHADFFRNELMRLLDEHAWRSKPAGAAGAGTSQEPDGSGERPRILITGTADYSMLAFVIEAWQRSRHEATDRRPDPRIDVLDICPTPLLACRWYANHVVPFQIGTHEADIRKESTVKTLCSEVDGYHLIVTDAFLTRFDDIDASVVLNRWADLLAPGGHVVTTVRLHPEDQPGDGLDEITEFTMRARGIARRWKPQLRSSIDAICDDAREYARRITSTDLGGKQEVVGLFNAAGFEIMQCTPSERLQGELQSTKYLRVIARKRENNEARPVFEAV
ncbi:hypothetical protein KDL01_06325 [Actinospica durhamensis]|uniref:Uncharacterized protein n=1 Tax=Actinospica durhamensis TaxID=1508375 RepID=A0A941EPN5_9ACTN|nr:hypothetical protein [Actinospica durhamensis]MBR7832869.1 hypothetical protein [Actinospica durhamensis]